MSRKLLIVVCLSALLLAGVVLATTADLKIDITQEGDCTVKAKKGDQIEVHYAGKLTNGNEFDNSFKRGQPIGVKLGAGPLFPPPNSSPIVASNLGCTGLIPIIQFIFPIHFSNSIFFFFFLFSF